MESASAIYADESIPDLPNPPDIEPAVIRETERQQTGRIFDCHQCRVPQSLNDSIVDCHKRKC
jgi:hypothetical protein